MISDKIKKWVHLSYEEVKNKGFVSIHIDELFDDEYSNVTWLSQIVESFKSLIEITNDRHDLILPMAIIPLGYSNKINTVVPDINKLSFNDEPPSLYLVDRETSKKLEVTEEYKVPMFNMIKNLDEPFVYQYYRCFRNIDSIKHDWEFCCCIYLEYYPKDLC